MKDDDVAVALRSPARLVVVEAPAGCGKTFQGAEYARDVASSVAPGRLLILTHTHAALDEFARRIRGIDRVDVRTIDGLITEIAAAYRVSLRLPEEPAVWARCTQNGYAELASRVARLLEAAPMIGRALATRYPIVVFDEHQDATREQHQLCMEFLKAGSQVRVFGDRMQLIFPERRKDAEKSDWERWRQFHTDAECCCDLETPHRWSGQSSELGAWTLEARRSLMSGGAVDLRAGLPDQVVVFYAENASKAYGDYRLSREDGDPVRKYVRKSGSLLVLAPTRRSANALRPFFNRTYPAWEGHVRYALDDLVRAIRGKNDPAVAVEAMIAFAQNVMVGFNKAGYADPLRAQVACGCTRKARGRPAELQRIARYILEEPNYRGVASALRALRELMREDSRFSDLKLDARMELADAIRLGGYPTVEEGLGEMARLRTYARPALSGTAISTIHKAKGLECDHAILLPCDAANLGNSAKARCVFYVGLTRAKQSLAIVVSRTKPSPLVLV